MKSLWQDFNTEDKYGHLLAVLVCAFLVFPFVENIKTELSLISLIFFVVILFSFRTIRHTSKLSKWFWIFGIGAFALDVLLWLYAPGTVKKSFLALSLLVYAGFLVFALVTMMRGIFSGNKVSIDKVLAGICIYLLIGFLWTLFYSIVNFVDVDAFHFTEKRDSISLLYYSFVTLTTVGYGDIFPVNKLAMSLSNLEAITGQVYMGIFIARLVGLYIAQSIKDETR